MDVLTVIIIVAGTITMIISISNGVAAKKRRNAYKANGQIRERDYDFYKMRHVFFTYVSSVKQIYDHLDLSALKHEGISVTPKLNNRQIIFTNRPAGGSAVYALAAVGKGNDGRNKYDFRLTEWESDPSGIDALCSNYLLTMIEKTILLLDYYADVQRTYVQHSVKTKFI